MTSGGWSISRRLTIRIVLTTALFVVAIAALSAWFIKSSLDREFELLVHEEFEELEAFLHGRVATRGAFEDITSRLSDNHREHGLSWRVWPEGSDDVWEFDRAGLLAGRDLDADAVAAMQSPEPGLRWSVQHLDLESSSGPGAPRSARVGLLLDGRGHRRIARATIFQAAAVLVISAALTALGGVLFGRRVSSMLREITHRVRDLQVPTGPVSVDIEDAPDEIREVADALSERLQIIRQESERAQLMTAGLAHELRSPIQNLLGEAEVALMRKRTVGEYQEVLRSQLEELRDLGRVVDNLVTLCANGQGDARDMLEVFDLGDEAGLRLTKERSAAESAHVRLGISTTGDLSLRGDREAILLVLRNLVSNAIHWSPPEGRVTLALDGDDDDEVRITVEDQGPGIPHAEREKVFEPFYRGSSQNGRRVGYGLGLALSRRAIHTHGGEIELSDSESGGARFRVRLPRG